MRTDMPTKLELPSRPGADELRARSRGEPRQGRRPRPRGRARRRASRLPARALPRAVFLPARRHRALRSGRADSRPEHRASGRSCPRRESRRRRFALRAARRRASITTPRSSLHADGSARRRLPQDAHSRRSALLREVLLHARRPRLPGVRHRRSAGSARSSAGTSGIPRARA